MTNVKRLVYLACGPLLFLACSFLLPDSVFTTFEAKAAIGTVAWMAFWWVTGPVDYAVTGLLPIAVNALFQIVDMKTVIANYSSETILLLLGASILTVSWEETGLDKRIAARVLSFVGSNLRTQLLLWFVLSVVASAVLPNAVVAATFIPIALSMLKYVGEGDIANSRVGSKLLLYIVYAAGIGGLASPLGGAMNLVIVDYLQQVTGTEYMYIDWVIRFLPIIIVLMIISIVFMLRDVPRDQSLGKSKEYFIEQCKSMPKMSREEGVVLAAFLIATLLAFTRQLYAGVLPGLKPAYVFIIAGILTFLVTRPQDHSRIMLWKSVQGKIVWGLMFIYAGGLAAGTLMNDSGAAKCIGDLAGNAGLQSGLLLVFVIVVFTLLMSDVTSNTATAAIAIPIVISITQGMNVNPIPYIYIATIGVNLSFMLPTSIRAIPVGHGLSPRYMLQEGWKISIAVIVLMTAMGFAFMELWPAFSVA